MISGSRVLLGRAVTIAVVLPIVAVNLSTGFVHAQFTSFNLHEATVPQMQSAMGSGLITSEYLVQQYLKRIDTFDNQGPNLNSILSLNPNAMETARMLDHEREVAGPRGPLHGIPVLLKDNIDTFDLPTTGGALILKDSVPPDDAFLTRKLRDAGAIILGKANLVELANFVSFDMPDGFSAVGGQTLNPYGPGEISPFGSSAGSAVAVASNLAAVAVGTETLGSIIAPSSINSVVGIRPTLGLISRDGIIPIAASQDTAGPISRTVEDAAIMLGAMAGVDPNDPATAASAGRVPADYTQFLDPNGLTGKRLGIVRHPILNAPDFISESRLAAAEQAFAELDRLGAVVIDDLDMSSSFFPTFELWGPDVPAVLTYEFYSGIADYLASLGESAPAETLADIIAFNTANADEAIPFGQNILEASEATGGDLTSPIYQEQLESGLRLFGPEGFDALIESHDLDALVFADIWSAFGAIPGYPSISVPAGFDDETGEPISIEFLAGPYSEPDLIELAYGFEQGTLLREPPATTPAIEGDVVGLPPGIEGNPGLVDNPGLGGKLPPGLRGGLPSQSHHSAVPEPTSALLLLIGSFVFLVKRRV